MMGRCPGGALAGLGSMPSSSSACSLWSSFAAQAYSRSRRSLFRIPHLRGQGKLHE
jgi:hypothetical protein